ncbi:InlB B-repeat-containing protein [Chitinispirillales bacterium ANBcel5]|uniref:InlB B-repeat-containing protein n=1 Tax=Cellulosispirillum alkaliphilum TaxID=3039283 RepID=UPI002A50F9F4|nr:InlB B-repeat-containing protein [Chitinispirillales bacterium ANBcel5]
MKKYLLFILYSLILFGSACEHPEDPIERASLDLYLHDEDSRIVVGEPFEVVMDLVGGEYIENITIDFGDSREKLITDSLSTDEWEGKLPLTLTYDSAGTYTLFITVEFIRNVQREAELTLKVYPVYSITYNSTKHDSGDVPNDTMFYQTDQSATVLGNIGELSRDGFEFAGWSIDDISSEIFKAGDTLTITNENINLYARWNEATITDSFTVTFDFNYDSVVITQSVEEGSLLAQPSEPQKREGYIFEGWYSDQDMNTEWDFETGVIKSDTTLFAYWSVVVYEISYNLNGGSNHDDNPNSYTIESEAISLKNASREGFSFLGWFVDSVRISQIESGSTGDLILDAKWTENPVFFIAYHGNGNTEGSAPDTAFYEEGAEVTVAGAGNLTRTGHHFIGWNTDPDGEGDTFDPNGTFKMETDDLNLHAQWKLNVYTVSFDSNGGSEVDSQRVKHGEIAEEPDAPRREGYRFSGWFRDRNLTLPFDFHDIVIQNNRTIYAKWAPLSNTVNFKANDGSGSMDPQIIATDQTAPLDSNQFIRTGYTFNSWNTEPDGRGDSYEDQAEFTMGTQGVTLYAQWSANENTVTFDANGGSGSMAPQTIATDQTAPLDSNLFTRTGYSFNGWNTEIDGSGDSYEDEAEFTMGTEDVILYAQWDINQYTITFNSNGGTEVDPITQDFGTAITTPEDPERAGYSFIEWNPGIPETMPASDDTLTAQWSINQYTITFNSNGGTEIEPITQDFGTAITTPVDPERTGYSFIEWNPGIPETMPASDDTLTAQWSAIEHTITYTLYNGTNHVSNPDTYTIEETITFQDPSKPDWGFDGWYEDADFSTPITGISLGSIGNVEVFAKWLWNGPDPVDGDGNSYTTVQIGNQVWTVENLRTTRYTDSTLIPHVTDNSEWSNLSTPAYCWYNNDDTQGYGALYNWWVVDPANPKNIAPEGWRVPTDEDWTELQNYLIANGYNWDGSTTGNKIGKALASDGGEWITDSREGRVGNDQSSNNSSDFSALPGGFRLPRGIGIVGGNGAWWSATELDASVAYGRRLRYEDEALGRDVYNKGCGFSVRLLRDED